MALRLRRLVVALTLAGAAVGLGTQGLGTVGPLAAVPGVSDLHLSTVPMSLGALTTPLPSEMPRARASDGRRSPSMADSSGPGGWALLPAAWTLASLAAAAAWCIRADRARSGRRGLVRRRGPPILLLVSG